MTRPEIITVELNKLPKFVETYVVNLETQYVKLAIAMRRGIRVNAWKTNPAGTKLGILTTTNYSSYTNAIVILDNPDEDKLYSHADSICPRKCKCGKAVDVKELKGNMFAVVCPSCGYFGSAAINRYFAIEAWNTLISDQKPKLSYAEEEKIAEPYIPRAGGL